VGRLLPILGDVGETIMRDVVSLGAGEEVLRAAGERHVNAGGQA
jgi:hypothetical protein